MVLKNIRRVVLALSAALLAGCGTQKPVLCVGTGPVTKSDVIGIRALARDIATATGGKLTDTSEHYATREVGPDRSVGFAVQMPSGEVSMLSSGTLTPVACFYGEPTAADVDVLIERMIDGLHRLKLPLTMANAGKVDHLPVELQKKIAAVVERK